LIGYSKAWDPTEETGVDSQRPRVVVGALVLQRRFLDSVRYHIS
jgi:hypothetical protein